MSFYGGPLFVEFLGKVRVLSSRVAVWKQFHLNQCVARTRHKRRKKIVRRVNVYERMILNCFWRHTFILNYSTLVPLQFTFSGVWVRPPYPIQCIRITIKFECLQCKINLLYTDSLGTPILLPLLLMTIGLDFSIIHPHSILLSFSISFYIWSYIFIFHTVSLFPWTILSS
jgi:hypothetical protein